MGHKISKEQIDPGVKDHIMSFVGDVADLETEVTTDIISAVNSLMVDRVDNAENMGKLANAIGEPVTANHSVDEVVEGLGEMLSTFKTNMMNSGVMVESSDKFKQLIDKIQGLTEGEGNKGIQYAEGTFDNLIINDTKNDFSVPINIALDLDFIPTVLFIKIEHNISVDLIGGNAEAIICNLFDNTFYSNYSSNTGYTTTFIVDNITQTNCTITRKINFNSTSDSLWLYTKILGYYAIGVGEEDTTLRDSLASILEEKGIDVNEDDDMANLITSIDQSLIKKPKLVISDTVNDISFGSVTLKLYGSRTTAPGDVGSTSVTITDIADKCECVSAKVTISHASSYNSSFVNINCTQYRDEVLIATLHNVTLCWPNHGTTVIELTDFKKGDVLVLSVMLLHIIVILQKNLICQ